MIGIALIIADAAVVPVIHAGIADLRRVGVVLNPDSLLLGNLDVLLYAALGPGVFCNTGLDVGRAQYAS